MKAINRKAFLALAGSTILTLAGCSNNEPVKKEPEPEQDTASKIDGIDTDEHAEESKTGQVGEPIDTGSAIITIEALEHSKSNEDIYRDWGDVRDDEIVLMLTATFKNISMSADMSDGSLYIDDLIRLKDDQGVTATSVMSSTSYGMYDVVTGSTLDCPIGEAKHVAIPYIVPSDIPSWSAQVGNTNVPLTITEVQ